MSLVDTTITWSTYFRNKASQPHKNPKYNGRTIIHQKSPSQFDKLYQDILSNILSFCNTLDVCEIMCINKYLLFTTRSLQWYDMTTCVYDITLFTHVFPNALTCRLALNSECHWGNSFPMEYLGNYKMVFEDFSLLGNMKIILLDETILNCKTDCELVDGLFALPTSVETIKFVSKKNVRMSANLSFLFSFCSEYCIVVHFEEIDTDYIYDPYSVYNSMAAEQYFVTSLQELADEVILSYSGPRILRSEEEAYRDYISLKTPYWDYPSEPLEFEQEILFHECLQQADIDETNVNYIMQESFKLKTRKIKNNHKGKITTVVKKK